MNPKSLLRGLYILCFFLSLSLLVQIDLVLSSVDPQFLACVPKSCGDGGLNISYPFYIQGLQEPFCGYPGFKVYCNGSHQPILELFNTQYVIHEIFYEDKFLRVSNAAFSMLGDESACVPYQNRTLPFDSEDPFEVGQGQRDAYLLYGCNTTSYSNIEAGYQVVGSGCANEVDDGGSETGRVMGLYGPADEGEIRDARESWNCTGGLARAILEEGGGGGGITIREGLRRGFLMEWTASDCSVCNRTGGRCGFEEETYHFKCFCPDRPHSAQCHPEDKQLQLKLGIGLGLGIPATVLIGFIILYYSKLKSASSHFQPTNTNSDPSSTSDLEQGSICFGVPLFSYCELEEATNNFDTGRELGDGGFGTVYHGKLKDGREVAVKRLYEHNYKRVQQFINEVLILTRLRHQNLVSLYGCTSRQSRELLLVYEYIPNGTVADHLHGNQAKPGSLPWSIRMKIAIETASALVYLHASDIVHRDVKTNNILLDNNFCIKVADFGLSRLFPTDVTHVSTAPQGTPGYVDPEYHQCYQLTSKSDVYSFGVVLAELLSSMPAVDITRHRQEINLANLALNKIQRSAFAELVDPSLGFESDTEVRRMTISVAELAYQCLQQDKEMRPSMDEVLEALTEIQNGIYEPQKQCISHDHQDGLLSSTKPPPPPSPECDEVGLLKNIKLPPSPISVNSKWDSKSTTSNATVVSSYL